MALIKCPDCGTEVSDQAPGCPKCRRPMTQPAVQTIEKTGKRYKLQMLLAVALIIVGPVTCMAGFGGPTGEPSAAAGFGGLMFLGGLIWLFATKIWAWWHHG